MPTVMEKGRLGQGDFEVVEMTSARRGAAGQPHLRSSVFSVDCALPEGRDLVRSWCGAGWHTVGVR